MKALITGATGFIGSHLADHLHAKGYDLRVMVRPTSSTKNISHLPVEYVTASFTDPASLREAVRDVDYVYHVAGATAAKNREGFFAANQVATRNLLDAVAEANPGLKRMIHVSSQAAAGPSSSADDPIDETAPLRPITAYGESKAAAEREVIARMGDLPLTIVRPPAVYGPRDVEIFKFFQVVARGFAPLIGFDRKLVSLVHVDDLVRGFIQAGESDRAVGETYFISSEEFYTWEHVGEITARAFGRPRARHLRIPHALVFAAAGISGFLGRFQKKPPVFNFEKGRDITQRYWLCKVDKARQHFGYRQQISIQQGVEQTVAWYKKMKWL
ncbi:MAG: hypothetical protein JWQ98_2741 [Chlorobi bacterium]|nr:hypothetical protein [Chlorobiota bacterium]